MPGIGIGIRIDAYTRSLTSYWRAQSECYELWHITGAGNVIGLKRGDTLVVGGTAGSYTFQCPNTAGYISADTDYIWFKQNAVQRTPTEAELIGYDFTRTIVKYLNASPYSVEYVMILGSTVIPGSAKENRMRDDFDLSIWWSGTLSAHGNVKGNKLLAQKYTWSSALITAASDTFTGADTTAIAAHTMDVGTGWTLVAGAFTILTNKIIGSNSTGNSMAFFDDGKADGIKNLNVVMPAANGYVGGPMLRYLDATHYWKVLLLRTGAGTPRILLQDPAGTELATANVTHEAGVERTLKVVLLGESITAYWNNVFLWTYATATAQKTLTKHGIFTYKDVANYARMTFDTLLTQYYP